MTEGTKSYFFGCHSFVVHTILVAAAWKRIYGKWPCWWQWVCIALHDVGHIGIQYLSDPAQKRQHWVLGAKLAGKLFGNKGYALVAGHSKNSGLSRSELYLPDKLSWLIAPNWWLWCNRWIEGFDHTPSEWKAEIRQNMTLGFPKGCHQLFLDRRNSRS